MILTYTDNIAPPQEWKNGSSDPLDARLWGFVELEFRNVTGAITICRDLSDATTPLSAFYDQNDNGPYSAVTAAGVYQFTGGGKMRWVAASGAPTCIVRASR